MIISKKASRLPEAKQITENRAMKNSNQLLIHLLCVLQKKTDLSQQSTKSNNQQTWWEKNQQTNTKKNTQQ